MAGPGAAKLPLALTTGGDSDAFQAPSQVAVQVTHYSSPTCAIALLDPANGQVIAYRTVTRGQNNDRTVLDPGGHQTVYVANSTTSGCTVKVSAAP
jgi:hypothetical protein